MIKDEFKEMGLTCPSEEVSDAQFALKVKKGKVKTMTCNKLAKKKPKVIQKVCYATKYQLYPDDNSLPASQVCPATCADGSKIEEDPSGKGKFSIMVDEDGEVVEEVFTCGDLKEKGFSSIENDVKDAIWACLDGYKKYDGGKKYSGANKVCQETCEVLMNMIEEGDEE
jgi:hypothetical protein